MHALQHACAGKVMYQLPGLGAVLCGKYQFCLSGTRNLHFGILIHIAVSMSCQRNGLFPVLYAGFDALYHDGGTEYGAV